MNRLILKYGYPVTIVILLIFVWVITRRLGQGVGAIIPLAVAAAIVWLLGTVAFLCFWPRITVGGFKRAILRRGLGDGPIPVNTLSTAPNRSSLPASGGSLIATGADDLLYIAGWLDLKAGPRVLHVPEMSGRYYSLQFTDPASGANVAYVGKRTTGTGAGEYLLCEAGWSGDVPDGMTRVDMPHRHALVVGRVFVADDEDQPAADALARQIRLSPLDDRG